jgi:large subunit ribosomal protein L35
MPKMKSRRSAVKRFKVTGTGKIRRHQAFTNHMRTAKTTKRKRQLRTDLPVSPADASRIRRLITV